jgi:hypothetical protein
MPSFLILTPPAGPDRDHRSTRFIADGLSVSAFFFPWIWMFSRGLWLWGVAALLAQGIGAQFFADDALAPAGLAILLTTSLFAALEGKKLEAALLQKSGWKLEDLLLAPDLGTAEAMYFNTLPAPAAPTMPATADWVADQRGAPKSTFRARGPALGLFDNQGGR